MSLHCSQRGRGESLVLLHGWGMNSAVWEGVAAQLEGLFTLTLIDLPGHGASEALVCADDVESILSEWLDAVDAVLPDRFYLCGWSLGGMLALAIQQRWPHRVQGVVLIASSPLFVAKSGWPALPDKNLQAFADDLLANTTVTLKQFFALQFMGVEGGRATMRGLWSALDSQGMVKEPALLQGLTLLKTLDLRDAYRDLSVPRGVLLGGKDRLVPMALEKELQALNVECNVECWLDAGHAPHVTHSGRTADFIKRVFL